MPLRALVSSAVWREPAAVWSWLHWRPSTRALPTGEDMLIIARVRFSLGTHGADVMVADLVQRPGRRGEIRAGDRPQAPGGVATQDDRVAGIEQRGPRGERTVLATVGVRAAPRSRTDLRRTEAPRPTLPRVGASGGSHGRCLPSATWRAPAPRRIGVLSPVSDAGGAREPALGSVGAGRSAAAVRRRSGG